MYLDKVIDNKFLFISAFLLLLFTSKAIAQSEVENPFSDLGMGTELVVTDIVEDSNGNIYAGGRFNYMGGKLHTNLAVWDGEEWSSFGEPESSGNHVRAMYYDEPYIFVGFEFSDLTVQHNGVTTEIEHGLAVYNTETDTWGSVNCDNSDQVGSPTISACNSVYDFEKSDAGNLYMAAGAGLFNVNSTSISRVTNTDASTGSIRALQYHDGYMYVGGSFSELHHIAEEGEEDNFLEVNSVARYNYSTNSWEKAGTGFRGNVEELYRHSSTGNFYALGRILSIYGEDENDETDADLIAVWNEEEENWEHPGIGADDVGLAAFGMVHSVTSDENSIYIGGNFNVLFRQDGSELTSRQFAAFNPETNEWRTDANGNSYGGEGFSNEFQQNRIQGADFPLGYVFSIHKSGDEFFIGGTFDTVREGHDEEGQQLAYRMYGITRFDGETYHNIGNGFDDIITDVQPVGDQYYVTGAFRRAYVNGEAIELNGVALFDPSEGSFSALGQGLQRCENRTAGYRNCAQYGNRLHYDEDDEMLYVGGSFEYVTQENGENVQSPLTARWDGNQWHAMGNGLEPIFEFGTRDFISYGQGYIKQIEDIDGQIYIAGAFSAVDDGSVPGAFITRWDPETEQWESVSKPENYDVIAAYHFDFDDEKIVVGAEASTASSDFDEKYLLFQIDRETGEAERMDLRSEGGGDAVSKVAIDGDFIYIFHNLNTIVTPHERGEEVTRYSQMVIYDYAADQWDVKEDRFLKMNDRVTALVKKGNSLFLSQPQPASNDLLESEGSPQEAHPTINARDGSIINEEEFDAGDRGPSHFSQRFRAYKDDSYLSIGPFWFKNPGITEEREALHYVDVTYFDDFLEEPIAEFQDSIEVWLYDDETADESIRLANRGSIPLDGIFAGSESVNWISYADSRNLNPATSDSLILQFDPEGLETGRYQETVSFNSNDPVRETLETNITLVVNPPEMVTHKTPLDGTFPVSLNDSLKWDLGAYTDSITVKVSEQADFEEAQIAYSGEPVEAVGMDQFSAERRTTYFWKVISSNSGADVESSPQSFETEAEEVDQIVIGNLDNQVSYMPVYFFTEKNYHQSIYEADEVVGTGLIDTLSFKYGGDATMDQDWRVYMATTNVDEYESTQGWVPVSEMTEVADTTISFEETGESSWIHITLNSGFEFSGEENLAISIYKYGDNFEEDRPVINFYASDSDKSQSLLWHGVNGDGPTGAAGNGYTRQERPDITLYFGEEPDSHPITLLSPSDGADDVSTEPEFSWMSNVDGEEYRLQVAADADFTDLIINRGGMNETSYTLEEPLESGETHYWRVRIDDANSEWSTVWTFTTSMATGTEGVAEIPNDVELNQNYPNPFNPATIIEYGIPESGHVQLEVFNVLGQRVAILVDEQQQAGFHTVTFDGSDLASGVYFYRIQSGDRQITNRMTFIK